MKQTTHLHHSALTPPPKQDALKEHEQPLIIPNDDAEIDAAIRVLEDKWRTEK